MSAQNPSGTGYDSFVDPYNFEQPEIPKDYTNIDSIWGKFGQLLGFVDKNQYENWKDYVNREYERQATLSARAYDTWKENTHYQRMVKDLEAAGLNPWLALQSGISGNQTGQTATSGSSARSQTSKKDSSTTGIAMLIMSIAKLISVLA